MKIGDTEFNFTFRAIKNVVNMSHVERQDYLLRNNIPTLELFKQSATSYLDSLGRSFPDARGYMLLVRAMWRHDGKVQMFSLAFCTPRR